MSSHSSPSSSPPSSPALGPVDSSPPASPTTCSAPESPAPTDPYAGSNKWTQRQYDAQVKVKPLGWGSANAYPERAIDARDPFVDVFSSSSSSYVKELPKSLSAPHVDPYAASAHKTWTPPRREKKPFSRSTSDWPAVPVDRPLGSDLRYDDVDLDDDGPSPGYTLMDTEEDIWDKVLERAVDKVDVEINLANSPLLSNPLTYIPPSIIDLDNIVVLKPELLDPALAAATAAPVHTQRTFKRSVTVPVMPHYHASFLHNDTTRKRFKAGSASLVRTATAAIHLDDAPKSRGDIKLFLSNNKIRSLPLELFGVSGLTVLSLRSNQVSVMPSQVARLTNLRELSIPFNKLRWLPAEMLGMQPMTLTVTRNEWIHPSYPPNSLGSAKPPAHTEPTRTHVSPTTVYFAVPPLTEFCLRALCTPVARVEQQQQKGKGTVIELIYTVPFTSTDRLPPHILRTLRACVPDAVAKPAAMPSPSKRARRTLQPTARRAHTPSPESTAIAEEPGLSVCPSPVHRTEDGDWVDGRVPVYVRHAEERFTWEREIAGTDVKAECGGAGVPVRWRGCLRGCLDFLDPGASEVDADDGVVVDALPDRTEEEADGSAVDVQIVHFSSRPLEYGDEDFE